jgi:hypothetical protein
LQSIDILTARAGVAWDDRELPKPALQTVYDADLMRGNIQRISN